MLLIGYSLLYLPKCELLSLTKSLGVHCSTLQITIQTRNNYIRIIMTVVIIYPVQRPLSPTHRLFVCNLANLSTIMAQKFGADQQFNNSLCCNGITRVIYFMVFILVNICFPLRINLSEDVFHGRRRGRRRGRRFRCSDDGLQNRKNERLVRGIQLIRDSDTFVFGRLSLDDRVRVRHLFHLVLVSFA